MHKALFSGCIRTLGAPRGSDCPKQPCLGVAPSAPGWTLHLCPSVCPSTWAVQCLCSAGCMSSSLPWLPAGPQPCSPLHLGLEASGPWPALVAVPALDFLPGGCPLLLQPPCPTGHPPTHTPRTPEGLLDADGLILYFLYTFTQNESICILVPE